MKWIKKRDGGYTFRNSLLISSLIKKKKKKKRKEKEKEKNSLTERNLTDSKEKGIIKGK